MFADRNRNWGHGPLLMNLHGINEREETSQLKSCAVSASSPQAHKGAGAAKEAAQITAKNARSEAASPADRGVFSGGFLNRDRDRGRDGAHGVRCHRCGDGVGGNWCCGCDNRWCERWNRGAMWSCNCARIQTKEASRRLPWPEEFSSGSSAQAGGILLRLYSVCGRKQNLIGQANHKVREGHFFILNRLPTPAHPNFLYNLGLNNNQISRSGQIA